MRGGFRHRPRSGGRERKKEEGERERKREDTRTGTRTGMGIGMGKSVQAVDTSGEMQETMMEMGV